MSKSIYQQALDILQQSFQTYSIKHAKMKSQKELEALWQSHNNDTTHENEIRMAILYFYHQCGLGCFVHYDKSTLHIITRIKDREHNIYIDSICKFLRDNTHYTHEKIKQGELTKEDFKELFDFVESSLDLQASTKREMIKIALRNVFDIHARDALFFKNGEIRFFTFDYDSVRINNEIRKINSNAHINVLSNEDTQALDSALLATNIQAIIVQNTISILQDDIHLRSIDNLQFNKRFSFFAIQRLRLYIDTLPVSHIDSLAKSIYCMNLAHKYASVMFEIVAKELLELCLKHDSNAIRFVDFYNGGALELRGQILKKPLISDSNGNPWSLHLIQKALKDKANVEFNIHKMQQDASNIESELERIAQTTATKQTTLQDLHAQAEYYKDTLESKNKALRELVNTKAPKKHIDTLSEEINTSIAKKSHIISSIEEIQKELLALNNQQIKLLESEERLKQHISYTFRKNRDVFLQYDLLSRALADAIANGSSLM